MGECGLRRRFGSRNRKRGINIGVVFNSNQMEIAGDGYGSLALYFMLRLYSAALDSYALQVLARERYGNQS